MAVGAVQLPRQMRRHTLSHDVQPIIKVLRGGGGRDTYQHSIFESNGGGEAILGLNGLLERVHFRLDS